MVKPRKLCYISVPSQIISSISSSSLQSLLESPKKSSRSIKFFSFRTSRPKLWFLTLFFVAFFGMLKFGFDFDIPFSPYPCQLSLPLISNTAHSLSSHQNLQKDEILENTRLSSSSSLMPLASNVEVREEGGDEKSEFWKQPDGLGYRPCLDFSREYRKQTQGVVNNRRKYLMVVVSGGMNQQRNQIVDAVVIARILGAALVVPILQVNQIWGDER